MSAVRRDAGALAAKADAPAPSKPRVVEPSNRWGGVTYEYRGARIEVEAKGYLSRLVMPGHPFDGSWHGLWGGWLRIIDSWIDNETLPAPYRLSERRVAQGHTEPPLRSPS